MQRTIVAVLVSVCLVVTTSCATLLSQDKETIGISSRTPGAQVMVDGAPMGKTPVQVPMDKTRNHTIVITHENGQTFTCTAQATLGAGWLILDVLLTFLLGVIVDAATGKWKSLDQTACHSPY